MTGAMGPALGSAMASALEDAEIGAPRADGIAVLVGHDPRDLMEMRQVVNGPGGEQLAQGDDSESRVTPAKLKLCRLDVELAEFGEIFRAEAGKFVEEVNERLPFHLAKVAETIEAFKSLTFARAKNHFDARHPVGMLTVNQVADDFGGSPRVLAFVATSPRIRQIAEKRIQSGGGAREKGDCLRQSVFHGASAADSLSDVGRAYCSCAAVWDVNRSRAEARNGAR